MPDNLYLEEAEDIDTLVNNVDVLIYHKYFMRGIILMEKKLV